MGNNTSNTIYTESEKLEIIDSIENQINNIYYIIINNKINPYEFIFNILNNIYNTPLSIFNKFEEGFISGLTYGFINYYTLLIHKNLPEIEIKKNIKDYLMLLLININ